MSNKILFCQIRVLQKTKIKPLAKNLILAYTRSTVKKVGLGSLGIKLLGDSISSHNYTDNSLLTLESIKASFPI